MTMEESEKKPTGTEEEKPVSDVVDEPAKKLAETEQQLAQYKDLLLRKAAEFENYKKRVDNESATIIRFANEDLIGEIIPVLDDFERFLKSAREQKNHEVLSRGVELVYQKLLKTLESQGVKAFETIGKEFDVHYHDALMQVHREGVPPHMILEEVEKGYLLNEKVIRHAKVVVSSASQQQDSPQTEEQTSGRP
ncbi:MAG: grpE [Bacteroidetes bacterium]|nr:grpE [Bacteroidota bacterium]